MLLIAKDLRSRVSQGSYGDEELKQFWQLAETAGPILGASNPELAMRAGLGTDFFVSVARDRRRPKLTNFLKALTAIIDIAEERLFEVGRSKISNEESVSVNVSDLIIEKDYSELLSLAISLEQMARSEIENLTRECPNDPERVQSNLKQRELLQIFADGFAQIADALAAFAANPNQPLLLGKARNAVNTVAHQITEWWRKNRADAVDWSVRIPVIAAAVAMLGWAGANMTVATSVIGAIVGGQKVASVFHRKKRN